MFSHLAIAPSVRGAAAATAGHGQLSAAGMIDREIARYRRAWRLSAPLGKLKFAQAAEDLFAADTRKTRIRELRVTVLIAVGFYYATTLADMVFTPDLGLTGLFLRLAALPIILSSVFLSPWFTNSGRELLVTVGAIVSILVLESIPMVSQAPLSPFAFGTGALGLIYANTTFPLRFRSACLNSLICGGLMILEVFVHGPRTIPLDCALAFQIVIAAAFSLIASYRIEHQMRLNYLFSTREALRFSGLSADRDFLTTLSNTDGLTGLANRRCFDLEIKARLADPSQAGKGVALLMVDVDHFKRYNDQYGHPAGDACLRKVATVLRSALRGADDLVARYGGEEFAILLFDLTPPQADSIAERICKAVAAQNIAHRNREDDVAVVTISMGMTYEIADQSLSVEMLIAAADQALYNAKRSGRNRVEASYAFAA